VGGPPTFLIRDLKMKVLQDRMREPVLSLFTKKRVKWKDLQGDNRPTCGVPECSNLAIIYQTDRKTGLKKWRRANWIKENYSDAEDIWCCSYHHNQYISKKNNVKSALHLTAKRQGLTVTEYQHQYHPYLKYRKDYCENKDGRLGFTCTTNIVWQGMLHVDHIDGNHTNNSSNNLQTLCACCHGYKTWKNQDYLSPGRKTRKSLKHLTSVVNNATL